LPAISHRAADTPAVLLHELQNTLASLKLRVALVAADPTCRMAQKDNLVALERILAEGMEQGHRLRRSLDRAGKAAPTRRRRASV
jgi:hypothetical protein